MGALFSKKTLVEQLEETEKAIASVRKNRFQSQQRQKRLVGAVTLWSIVLYLICAVGFLAIYFPPTWPLRLLYSTPLCFAPVLVYILRRIVLVYFSGKIKSADEELRSLIDRKKSLLETVREKESYKKAKEILEKYDPEYIKQKNMSEELQRLRSQSANNQVRRRYPGGTSSMLPQIPMASSPVGRLPVGMNQSALSLTTPGNFVRPAGPGASGSPPMAATSSSAVARPQARSLFAPVQMRSQSISSDFSSNSSGKSAFDRMMEFIVGDGPSNRYALICSHCLNHNGMALKEEFQYISFRCAYCGLANNAKKERPNAPRLPNTPLPQPVNSPSDHPSLSSMQGEKSTENEKEEDLLENGNEENQEVNGSEEGSESENESIKGKNNNRGSNNVEDDDALNEERKDCYPNVFSSNETMSSQKLHDDNSDTDEDEDGEPGRGMGSQLPSNNNNEENPHEQPHLQQPCCHGDDTETGSSDASVDSTNHKPSSNNNTQTSLDNKSSKTSNVTLTDDDVFPLSVNYDTFHVVSASNAVSETTALPDVIQNSQ